MSRQGSSVALFVVLLNAACGPASSTASDAGGTQIDSASQAIDARRSIDAMQDSATLDALLQDLRSDRDVALLRQSRSHGWPAPVEGGYLFVSAAGQPLVAGDHDSWQGTAMNTEDDFHWLVLAVNPGSRYKFTDGANDWLADPWSRSYAWDAEGIMSMVAPIHSHLERHFEVSDAQSAARSVRVWVPETSPTHVLYAHDGQNLFNPNAFWGGWKLNESAPAGLMVVGIDNSDARISEYTHTTDNLGGGQDGGAADAYATFVNSTVRDLIAVHYSEPAKVGTMGSSLGGLVALHIADRYPGEYDFVASLSATLGWGSIAGTGTDTMISRYQAAGHRGTAIYIDSGGNGGDCSDSDNDGTNDDDTSSTDNYCVTRQMESTLAGLGYVYDTDLWHWWQTDAPHNEQAWAARVFRPMEIFMGL